MKHLKVLKSSEVKLADAGYRLTTPRREILKALIDSDQPLSVSEIYSRVSEKAKIDRVSTYRILRVLKKMGLVHSVGEAGFIFCSHAHAEETQDNHLYLVCEACSEVEEIQVSEDFFKGLSAEILNVTEFQSDGPVQVTGLCKACNSVTKKRTKST